MELSVIALHDRFCDPQPRELRVSNFENLKYDLSTDNPEYLLNLQTKGLKTYPNPHPPPVIQVDAHSADSAIDQTRFDQDTARCAEIIHSAEEARSVEVRHQFMKNMPSWRRAELLKQLGNNTVE